MEGMSRVVNVPEYGCRGATSSTETPRCCKPILSASMETATPSGLGKIVSLYIPTIMSAASLCYGGTRIPLGTTSRTGSSSSGAEVGQQSATATELASESAESITLRSSLRTPASRSSLDTASAAPETHSSG